MIRIIYYFSIFLAALLYIGGAYAQQTEFQQIGQETQFDRRLRTDDDQPLREFVESKENIDVREKARNLEISGDVRFFYQNVQEKGLSIYLPEPDNTPSPVSPGRDSGYSSSGSLPPRRVDQNYRAFRGGSHVGTDGIPLSTNIFDVEFNLKIKYDYGKAWAMAHVQFDNPAGSKIALPCYVDGAIFNKDGSEVPEDVKRDTRKNLKGSGLGSSLALKRAYIGYNAWADGTNRVDIEVGRRKLDDIFDSEIQFSNYFDGVLLKYARSLGKFADFYWNTGGFVIDQRVNHFGYVTEFGLLDIWDTGLDLRYSFIDWRKRGNNRCKFHNPIGTRFANSQVTLTYTWEQEIYCQKIPMEFYSGFLINHAAKKNRFTNCKKENLGWYLGLYVGNVDEEGDWSFDIEYAVVQAQAVPDPDVASIGRGNIYNDFFYDQWVLRDDLFYPRRGNANFEGWRIEFLYAITDNLSLDFVFQASRAKNPNIGGRHNYRDCELEVIYAF